MAGSIINDCVQPEAVPPSHFYSHQEQLVNPDTLSARILAVGDTHQVDLPLRWGDSDALNHLNTLYFRLMEEAHAHPV